MATAKKSAKRAAPKSSSATKESVKENVRKEFKVASDNLVKTTKKLLHEGNVRKIILKSKNRTILEIPMTAGVAVGAIALVAAPVLAAVGAIAALVSEVTVVVERHGK